MTGNKRFTLKLGGFYDNNGFISAEESDILDLILTNEEVLNFLNSLYEENKQLKQTIETQNFNYENAKGIIHSSEKQIQQLHDENKKLNLQYKELEISLLNNQLAYIDLKKENVELKQFKDSVFCKIDMHLQRLPTLRDEEFNSNDEFADPSNYQGAIDILETIKKELNDE
ncbi:hypothetical protein [Methanobrevibacter sp.]